MKIKRIVIRNNSEDRSADFSMSNGHTVVLRPKEELIIEIPDNDLLDIIANVDLDTE